MKKIDPEKWREIHKKAERYRMGKGIAYPKGRPTLGVLPVWHIAYTDIEELKTVTKERRVVYEVTQAQVEQNALLPHLPVLSEMAQLFYLASDPRLVSFPQTIYPHECWWVYGIGECLITLKPKYVDEVAFIADLKELNGGLVAFKLPEFNPAVSLSYIWGNQSYNITRLDGLPTTYIPNRIEYEDAMDDHHSIITELSSDLQSLLEE